MPTRSGLPVTGKASQKPQDAGGSSDSKPILTASRYETAAPSTPSAAPPSCRARAFRSWPIRRRTSLSPPAPCPTEQNRRQGVRRERPRLYSQKGLGVRRTSSQLSGFLAYSCCCLLCDSHWARRRSRRSGGWTSIASAASSTAPSLPHQ
eukprot:7340810-Prymnesium_polylepis.1